MDSFSNNYQPLLRESQSQENRDYEAYIDTDLTPILITNDVRFYLLYKGVFSYTNFKLFCKIYDKYESLTPLEKHKVNCGNGTHEAFEYFEKLINGEGKFAYQYEINEKWHDESGNSRTMEIESGWKIQNQYSLNEEIKKRYGW